MIRCLREHAGRIRTKVSVAYGMLWDIENPRGDQDVYGPPVHISQRMSEHATKDTILIEEKDKELVGEWLGDSAKDLDFKIRRAQLETRSYPRARVCRISA